LNNHLQIKKR